MNSEVRFTFDKDSPEALRSLVFISGGAVIDLRGKRAPFKGERRAVEALMRRYPGAFKYVNTKAANPSETDETTAIIPPPADKEG